MLLTFIAGFDPISLTIEATLFAVLSTAGIPTALALAATPVIATGLVVGGLYAVGTLLAPKPPGLPGGGIAGNSAGGSVDPTNAKGTFSSQEAAELRAIGRVRLGGLKIFGNTSGTDRFRLTAHCKGEVAAFEEYYFAGRSVTVDDDGAVSSYPWGQLGGSNAYVYSKTGDDNETAWGQLTSAFPSLWTSNHRVRGIAQTLAKFVNPGLNTDRFLQLFQGGVPDVSATIRAELIYDPRDATTVWKDNGVLCALHIYLSSYKGVSLSDFDLDFIKSEATRADASIATLAGNVARSRCWGVFSSETARGDNMQKVLDSIGAWFVPRSDGNLLGIQLIDDDPASEFTVTLDHILDVDWGSGPQGVERPNVCRVKYYSPERNYAVDDVGLQAFDDGGNYIGPAWARVQDEVDAYGEKYFDVELPFCPNSGQAQRIARRMFLLARADSGIIKTDLAGMAVWGCRIVSFEFPDGLGTLKCQIGTPRILDGEGQVEIPFAVWPDLPTWVPANHEVAAPEQIPDLAYGSPLVTPDPPDAVTVISHPAADVLTRIHYVIPGDASIVEAVYRTYSAGLPNPWQGMTEFVGITGYATAYVGADLRGIVCDFRFRTFDTNQNGSAWSDIFNATPAMDNSAPGTPSITAVYLGGTAPVGDIRVTVRGPGSLNLSTLNVIGNGMPGVINCQPNEEQVYTATNQSSDTYTFSVTARASDGTSSGSASATMNVPPAAPALTLTAVGGGQIQVNWTAPASPNVDHLHFTGTDAPADPTVGSGDAGSWTTTSIAGSGTYIFTARAFAADGTGGDTTTQSITI